MGRKIPIGENSTNHPILSLSLLIACVAAAIAIVSSLCGSFSRKKSSSHRKNSDDQSAISQPNEFKNIPKKPVVSSPTGEADLENTRSTSQEFQKPLPPPPQLHTRASSYHFQSNSRAPLAKLTSSTSMKVQGGITALRQSSKREDIEKKKEKHYKNEDSVWKKQIILGERCRVPDEDDDTILYDENGNRISTYHPKTPVSLPLSRQSSEIDHNAIPR